MPTYPKISIVTVNLNNGAFLEEAIQSVIGQDYPNLEYIMIDGGSTDNSLEVIERYSSHFTYWESQKDEGQYHAIQKGFEKSTGDIMAWINSDDKYLPKAFFAVADIFNRFQHVHWLMGCAKEYTEQGVLVGQIHLPWCRWSKHRYYTNDFQFIQQESSFWSRSLWEKAGATLDTTIKLSGDMELWARFFRHEKLHTTTLELSGFRHRKGAQRSKDFRDIYLTECKEVIQREKRNMSTAQKLKLPFFIIARWFLGPFFFYDVPILNKMYPWIFNIPRLIQYDFMNHEYTTKKKLIQLPSFFIGGKQVHRKMFKQ
tara:strand:- start:23954 stop:24895 length:942 start_codon:yes stop_codon:yes gene_type:complete